MRTLNIYNDGNLLASHKIYNVKRGQEIPGFAVQVNKTGFYSVQEGKNGYQFFPFNAGIKGVTESLAYGLHYELI